MIHQLDSARQRMIDEHLRARGIVNERVLAAMARVPRDRFVAEETLHEAYADAALPIACGQTISQPYIVAMMSEALELTSREKVLEIGTGSGYQTAILAELAGEVYSIERHADLSQLAAERLTSLGYTNVHLHIGDGSLGWPAAAPFDRVIITAAGPRCPPPLWEQLAEGGLLIGPFGSSDEQRMNILRKRHGQAVVTRSIPCRFVPLVSETQFPGNQEPRTQ